MNPPGDRTPQRRTLVMGAAAVLAAVLWGFLIYRNAFSVPFLFDDFYTVVNNPHIRHAFRPQAVWEFDPSRFLTHYTFALNFLWGELAPEGYHLVNLVLHLANAGLYYLLLRALWPASRVSGAFWAGAALIFLSHPIQSQAVTYISQRSTLLATAAYLGSLLFYVRYRRAGAGRDYVFSVLAAFLGLTAKPIIITLPLAVLLIEVFFRSGFRPLSARRWAVQFLPFALVILLVPSLLLLWKTKAWALQDVLMMTRETQKFGRYEYALTQANVLATYVRLVVLPYGQHLDYDFPIARSFFSFPTWLSASFLALSLGFAWRARHRHPMASFAIFWIFVTMVPESSVFPIADVIFEHRVYLPMAGAALLLMCGLSKIFPNPKIRYAVLAVLIGGYGALTIARNEVWRDPVKFYTEMALYSPNKPRVVNNYGVALKMQGRMEESIAQFRRAIALDPEFEEAYSNLSSWYCEQGRFDEGRKIFEDLIVLNPRFFPSYYNLAVLYTNEKYKDLEKAWYYYGKTLEYKPNFPPAIVGIGRIYRELGDPARARFYIQKALVLDPSYALGYQNLADVYLIEGDMEKAKVYYLEALKRDPTLVTAHVNLGNIYSMAAVPEEAVRHYEAALKRDPSAAGMYVNLGRVYASMNDTPKARAYYEQALKLAAQNKDEPMAELARKGLEKLGK